MTLNCLIKQNAHDVNYSFSLLSPEMVPRLGNPGTDHQVRGWEKTSDHVPVWIELEDK